MSADSSVNVGRILLSTHTGSHVDAPLHYQEGGASVDTYALDVFIGPAFVWHAPQVALLRPSDLARIPDRVERLLIRTSASERQQDEWSDDFMAIAVDTIDELAGRGCQLIGIDGPSYDPADSKSLDAHHAIARHGIANLENLSLQGVAEGWYLLAALPMPLQGMDAAPLRAVLIQDLADIHINVTGVA